METKRFEPVAQKGTKQFHLLFYIAILLLQLNPALCQRSQISHVVGGQANLWAVLGDPTYYQTWAYGQQFVAGDKLVFHMVSSTTRYTSEHTVVEFPDIKSFMNCDPSGGMKFLQESEIPETVIVDLPNPGMYYFGCSTRDYCTRGQRFFIKVWPAPSAN
ncbi:hypothetical protein R1sor_020999 [Riccia sorocarpa]|uniref:Phytocyanin domain-containing protein n=1 Tax=Riccia sorocarpa TaxID=122646 RepID=A0ABD3GFS9_9MARC